MQIHTVREGETLYEISRLYGVSPTKIIENNGIESPDKLSVGRKLLILTPTRTYTIRGGDTLPRVANRFNVSERTLRRSNPYLCEKNMTYPEQVIAIKYDKPLHGSILFNGYYYKGTPEDRLELALAFANFITVSAYRQRGLALDNILDDTDVLRRTKAYGRNAVMRVYFPDGYESISDGGDRLIKAMVDTAEKKGYSGVCVAAYKAMKDEKFGQFLLNLKKELMLKNLTLTLECDGICERLCDIADSCVLVYEKCPLDEVPTFEEGEKPFYTDFAAECDSTKCYMDLSPFAYGGGAAMTQNQAYELAFRTGKEIAYDSDRMICSFEQKRIHGKGLADYSIVFEALENIKAKLELASELGYMGISFDIMRVPVAHLMMAGAMFAGSTDQSSFDM